MSDADNRLQLESEEIQKAFANHPKISVVSSEGTPPDKYVVAFNVEGLVKLDNGEIVQSDQHRVEISLSFGFPHFPPNCKPITGIFHPDIDPSAIKIADYWDKSKKLVDLVIHIAQMISWQVYSEENVFNPEARDWLADHAGDIPVDDYVFADAVAAPEDLGTATDVTESPVDLDESQLPEIQFEKVELAADDAGSQAISQTVPEEDGLPEIEFQSSAFEDVAAVSSANDSSADGLSPVTAGTDDGEPEIEFQSESLADISADSMRIDLGDGSGVGEDIGLDDGPVALPAEDVKLDLGLKETESDEEAVSDIVIENIAVDETLDGVQVESYSDDEIDLDLNEVDVDFDILSGMVDQRKYFAARKKFMALPVEQQSPEVKTLHARIEDHIEKAEQIHQEALDFENKGLLEKAAGRLDDVMEMAVDFPGIEADMKRVRNAWMLLSQEGQGAAESPPQADEPALTLEIEDVPAASLVEETVLPTMETEANVSSPPPPLDHGYVAAGGQPPASQTGSSSQPLPSSSGKASAVKKKSSVKPKASPKQNFFGQKQNRPIIIAGGVLFIAVLISLWGGYEWRSYAKAEGIWDNINGLLEVGNFDKAKADCARIKDLVSPIIIFKNGDKKELLAKVDGLLNSEHFREGIEGKILYNGHYVSKRAFRAYQQIEKLLSEGEKHGAVADWPKALATYEQAKNIAQQNKKRLDPKTISKVNLLARQTEFAKLVSEGKSFFIAANWSKAITALEKAIQLAKEKDVADSSTSYDVHRYLQRAKFAKLLQEADAFQKEEKWAEAVQKYSAAQKISAEKGIIEPIKVNSVLIKLAQTTLLRAMRDGNTWNKKKQWSKAVGEYEIAAKEVRQGVPLPGKSLIESEKVVFGYLLRAKINMEQNNARIFIAKKKYGKAHAAYQNLLATLNSTDYAADPELKAIFAKTKKQLRETELAGIIDEKKAYLLENYKKIFTDNFVGVRATALSQPQIDFLETKNDLLIFRLRCREQQEVKFFTLELVYQYDLIVGQWGFAKSD